MPPTRTVPSVQTADQLDQRRFAGAGAADNADGHAGFDLQINILQDHLLRVRRVFKADMVKRDAAVRHFHDWLGRVA